jgi:NAD(P)-dependent dehydrogenase (short-subunit alcohol dehydrogenase family)
MSHALIVGGTGMLRGVCARLARQMDEISVIARDAKRLAKLREEIARLTGRNSVVPISVDYLNSSALRMELQRSIELRGPVSLTIAWIHSIAPEAPYIVAECAGRGPSVSRFFHVLGSAGSDPSQPDPKRAERFRQFPLIDYRQVVLGFSRSGGASRWLTDEEICDGILQAIERDYWRHVIGTVHPWEAHP